MLDLIRDFLVAFIILEVVGGCIGLLVFGTIYNRKRSKALRAAEPQEPAPKTNYSAAASLPPDPQ